MKRQEPSSQQTRMLEKLVARLEEENSDEWKITYSEPTTYTYDISSEAQIRFSRTQTSIYVQVRHPEDRKISPLKLRVNRYKQKQTWNRLNELLGNIARQQDYSRQEKVGEQTTQLSSDFERWLNIK